MELKEKLLNIINTENKKDPLTDIQIAKFLGTTRENVTNLRKEFKISNSRERRMPYLKSAIQAMVLSNPNISVSELTRELLSQGFDITRRVVEGILSKNDNVYELFEDEQEVMDKSKEDPFQELIGSEGSLKTAIEQAKSAVLYPPNGLPMLITGESGVGKSLFSQKVFEYAKFRKVIKDKSEFVVFNCADYADNPQLLLSILFGYKKGAFTGAEQDTEGLIEKANGGLLFLDEIHRLPPKGQEILFSILDNGKYRRLGESTSERKVNIMLIGATTENIEESLLLTFRRRIPMMIHLPSLEERDLSEKIQLIDNIFQQECNRINSKIFLDKRVVEVLLIERFSGNIGQLRSKILVICARAFLKYINSQDNNNDDHIVTIDVNEIMRMKVSRDVEYQNVNYIDIKRHLKNKMFIPFKTDIRNISQMKKDFDEDIYIKIQNKHEELKKLNLSDEVMHDIVWKYLDRCFENIDFNEFEDEDFSMIELQNVVDEDIIKEVLILMDELLEKYNDNSINKSIFRYLAIHLESTLKRLRFGQQNININFEKIICNYSEEYEIAKNFSKRLERVLNIKIPENEVAFITFYIKSAFKEERKNENVGLMVICHGRIASELTKVVNYLVGSNPIVALDMPLEEKAIDTYDKAVELAKLVDCGKGILILVDLGSLVSIGDIITERTGIKTRVIDRVEISMLLDATRRVTVGNENLDEIYFNIIKDKVGNNNVFYPELSKKKAVVTVCMTGVGVALYIKESISKRYKDIAVFATSALRDDILEYIENIKKEYNIIGIIGNINPNIPNLEFIQYDNNVFQKLDAKFLASSSTNSEVVDINFIDDELIIYEPDIYFKADILEWICVQLINKGYVEKNYLNSVLKREEYAPTYSKGDVAVPHGDPTTVNKTGFVFVKLKNMIDWGVGNVNFIFMPVFKSGDREIVKSILGILNDKDFVNSVKISKSSDELKQIIRKKITEIKAT